MSPVMSFNTASSNPTLGREGHTQAIVQPVQAETAPAGSEALRAFLSRNGENWSNRTRPHCAQKDEQVRKAGKVPAPFQGAQKLEE